MSDHSPTPAPQPLSARELCSVVMAALPNSTTRPEVTAAWSAIDVMRDRLIAAEKPAAPAAPQEGTTPPATEWLCLATRRHFTGPFRCETSNAADATTCVACGSDRPSPDASAVDRFVSRITANPHFASNTEYALVLEINRLRALTSSQTDSSLRAAESHYGSDDEALKHPRSTVLADAVERLRKIALAGSKSDRADYGSFLSTLDASALLCEVEMADAARTILSTAASSPTVTPPQTPTLGGQAATQRELKAWRWLHWGTAASWACPCGHAHGRAIQICEDCQTPRPAMAIPLDYGFAVARSTPTEEKTNAE